MFQGRHIEQKEIPCNQKDFHVPTHILKKAKLDLPTEVKPILDKLKEVERNIQESQKNHLSDIKYVQLIESALQKLSPQTMQDYKDRDVKFLPTEETIAWLPIGQTDQGQWQVKIPLQYKKPVQLVLRAIEGILQIEHMQDRVAPITQRRTEIAARVFEVNENLGREHGWDIRGYEWAEKYREYYYDGIQEAFNYGSIDSNTLNHILKEIGHSYAHQKLIECITPQQGRPKNFPSFGPAAYFEERLVAIEQGQKRVKVGTEEFKELNKKLQSRKERGKDFTLTTNIMPNGDIWVQPYFISKEVKSYHSVNANGNPCIFAGEVEIDSNKLTRIKDQSGHFRTVDENDPWYILKLAVNAFQAKGFDTSEVIIVRASLHSDRNLEYSFQKK